MTGRIVQVAANTFRETVRDKFFYSIVVFSVFVIGLTYYLAELSVGDFNRVLIDFGLGAIHVFSVLVAIFLGITLLSKEVEKRTVYVILSRPVRRWEFIVGKFAGLFLTAAVSVAVMTVVLFLLVLAQSGRWFWGLWGASAGILLELGVLIGFSIVFSTFTTATMAAVFSFSAFVLGHLSRDLVFFGGRSSVPAVRTLSRALFLALPNLETFNYRNDVIYGDVRGAAFYGYAGGYFLAYLALLLLVSSVIFSRRDLK